MEDLDLDALLAATQTDMASDQDDKQAPDLATSPKHDEAAAAPTAEAADTIDDGLDFDLAGFDASPAKVATPPADLAKPAENDYGNQSVSKSDDLSMDFDVPELAANEDVSVASDAAGSASTANAMDFSDSSNDALAAPESPVATFETDTAFKNEYPSELAGAADPLDFDLSGISLDLDPDGTKAGDVRTGLVDDKPDVAAVSVVEDNLLNEPEMATKLDLAIAYEEIGDKEGARELLDEVIQGGSNEQVRKAAAMLTKFG
jgi:pilus assembly protein FimV